MRSSSVVSFTLLLLAPACSGSPPKPDPGPEREAEVAIVYGPAGGLVGREEAPAQRPPSPPPPRRASPARCLSGFAGTGAACHPTDPGMVEARGACERAGGELCQDYAETVLESLGAEHDRYEGARLESSDDPREMKRFARHLKQKVDTAQRLGAAYQGVASLPPGPWRHHAQVQEASVYDHLADALESLPVPGKLSEEQAEFFRQALAEKAAPVREKARDLYIAGVQGAAKLGLQDEIIAWAQRRLTELDADG